VAFAGLLTLIACAVLALSQVWEPWAAALFVGLVVCGIGAALLARGKVAFDGDRLKPKRTIASLKETKQFAKEQMS
jgi:uncharacterized protein (DUF2062 family)